MSIVRITLLAVAFVAVPHAPRAAEDADALRERFRGRPWLDVTSEEYGARGDGGTADQAAIQKALDDARLVGGVVYIPRTAQTYHVESLRIHAGIAIVSDGARLRQPDRTPNWKRLLFTDNTTWRSDEDSPPIHIVGLILDGNRQNRLPYAAYEKEQSHAVFLTADPSGRGRLRVFIDDLTVEDTPGDAVSLHRNADVTVSRLRARDCFRGGLVVTGGHSRLKATDVRLFGQVHSTGIDVEVGTPGYAGSLAADVYLSDVEMDGDFDLGMNDGGTAVIDHVVSHGAPFVVGGGQASAAVVRISDSKFTVGSGNTSLNRIVRPYDVRFDRVEFVLAKPPDGPGEYHAIYVNWNITGPIVASNQRLVFSNCRFVTAPGVPATDETYAIYSNPTPITLGNVLEISDSSISEGFAYGIRLVRGGELIVRDTEIHAHDTAISWKGMTTSQDYSARVLVDGVRTTSPYYMDIGESQTANVLTHQNVVMSERYNVFKTLGPATRAHTTFAGSRTILAAGVPSKTTHGLAGDVLVIKDENGARADDEYVCTRSGTADAVWVPRKP